MFRKTRFMADRNNYIKRKPLHPRAQIRDISEKYPGFECTWDANVMTCIGRIKPGELCRTYTVKIIYSLETPPTIKVIDPILKTLDGKKIPHTYGNEDLCLYYPKLREWTRYDLISETIIPWISLWLFYYEIWLATGKWEGGGIEHDVPQEEQALID